MLYKTFIWKV